MCKALGVGFRISDCWIQGFGFVARIHWPKATALSLKHRVLSGSEKGAEGKDQDFGLGLKQEAQRTPNHLTSRGRLV